MIFRVALLQLKHCDSTENHRLKGIEYCREAKEMGADIALFPEMWNVGYNTYAVSNNYRNKLPQDGAISLDHDFLKTFRELAVELDMAIGITFLEEFPLKPRNSLLIYDRKGNQVIHYSKVHTCDFSDEFACTPGDDFYTNVLDTASGDIVIGAMICYDREFPESARTLMLKGAEIILTPNACGLDEKRLVQFQTRAFENACGVAMANYANLSGHSVAYSGVENDRSMCIVLAGEDEGIYMADFDIDELRKYRKGTIWGDAYRRPSKYGKLLEMQSLSEFERETNRR